MCYGHVCINWHKQIFWLLYLLHCFTAMCINTLLCVSTNRLSRKIKAGNLINREIYYNLAYIFCESREHLNCIMEMCSLLILRLLKKIILSISLFLLLIFWWQIQPLLYFTLLWRILCQEIYCYRQVWQQVHFILAYI